MYRKASGNRYSEKLVHVKEYLVDVKECKCGIEYKGECHYGQRVQYGEGLKSLLVYFNQYQSIPTERIQEMIKDVFGLSISDGLIFSSTENCFSNLSETIETIKQGLIRSELMHNDEITHFSIHRKRGMEEIDETGILPEFRGVSIHDRWAS